jgi:hypothetical protein
MDLKGIDADGVNWTAVAVDGVKRSDSDGSQTERN